MTSIEDTGSASPLATLWLSPRQTIERIVSSRPTYLVLPLAVLGMIAGLYVELVSFGLADGLLADGRLADGLGGWRLWLGFLLGGAVIGVIWLYLSSAILTWVGMLLGGEASPRQLRAVIAWSTVPIILGALIAFVVGLALDASSAAASQWLPWLAIAFSLWSQLVFLLMLGRVERFGFMRTILAYVFNVVFSMIFALLLSLPIRILLYQPFNVPSRAMTPTLLEGDYFLASKLAFGYSRFSLPLLLPLPTRHILGAEPQRGDIVVFRLPKNLRTDFVKRVVGLPGEHIQMKDGALYINDVAVKREPLPDYVGRDPCGSAATATAKRWRETLPNGVSYETLDCVTNGFFDDTPVYTVPAGHYFMLGDNRDNSADSRALSAVGYVPFENLVGRADLIFFSRAPAEHGAPAMVRRERIGTVVR